jgi:hypothetical protein
MLNSFVEDLLTLFLGRGRKFQRIGEQAIQPTPAGRRCNGGPRARLDA